MSATDCAAELLSAHATACVPCPMRAAEPYSDDKQRLPQIWPVGCAEPTCARNEGSPAHKKRTDAFRGTVCCLLDSSEHASHQATCAVGLHAGPEDEQPGVRASKLACNVASTLPPAALAAQEARKRRASAQVPTDTAARATPYSRSPADPLELTLTKVPHASDRSVQLDVSAVPSQSADSASEDQMAGDADLSDTGSLEGWPSADATLDPLPLSPAMPEPGDEALPGQHGPSGLQIPRV
jgi:hypothetical protein